MPCRITRRKIIARVMVFLLLGAVVNVSVAWSIALLSHPQLILISPRHVQLASGNSADGGEWLMLLNENAGWSYAVIICSGPANDVWYGNLKNSLSSQTLPIIDPLPWWSRNPIKLPTGERQLASSVALGWPVLTMAAHFFESVPPRGRRSLRAEGGVSLRQGNWIFNPPTTLPTNAIWPGFAVNTIFYAAILFMLLVVATVLRRERRLKRGLCPACTYPIGTSVVCNECGATVPTGEGCGAERMS